MSGLIGTTKMVAKLQFSVVPEKAQNVQHLGSLVFDKTAELGPFAKIDLTQVETLPLLARDCIAAMYEHARPSVVASHLTIIAYKTAIWDILSYCWERGVKTDFRMNDLTIEFLLDYRAHLGVHRVENKSDARRRMFGCLIRLIEAGKVLGLSAPDFLAPRNFRKLHDSDRTLPYPPGELLDLEDACRTHIQQIVARLEEGKKLLSLGIDPRTRSQPASGSEVLTVEDRNWNKLPNLLWYVVNVLNGEAPSFGDLKKSKHWSFLNSMRGVMGGPFRKPDIYSHLYPLITDLIPFAVLLAKSTGRNESSILYLERNCLEEGPNRIYLLYRKERGGAKIYRKAIADDGPFSPVQLIKLLLKITEPLVRLTPESDKNLLFLGLTMHTHQSAPVKRLNASLFKIQMNHLRPTEESWCTRWGLTTESGEPFAVHFRRLRVTYLSLKYLKTGQLSKVSKDAAHVLATTSVPYVDNPSTKLVHEEAVERGIQSARSVARSLAVVADNAQAAEILGCDAESAERITEGRQDVFFAACRDFYHRPGGKENVPCDRPWQCFSCGNTVVTTHVLPRVVKFREFMQSQRAVLHANDWSEKFENVWEIVTKDVLTRFTADAIAHAEALAAKDVFYIPLRFKG